jgi:hypothetical protein
MKHHTDSVGKSVRRLSSPTPVVGAVLEKAAMAPYDYMYKRPRIIL